MELNEYITEYRVENNNGLTALENMFAVDDLVSASELTDRQIGILQDFSIAGVVENIDDRVFIKRDYEANDFLVRQLVIGTGIYALTTALFLWGLTDTYPDMIYMVVKQGYKLPTNKYGYWTQNVKAKQMRAPFFSEDIEELTVVGTQKKIQLYSKERTLVDIVRRKGVVPQEVINQAYRRYIKSDDKNLTKLLLVAKRMHAETQVKAIMGVLL